jgi:hypothetical protein
VGLPLNDKPNKSPIGYSAISPNVCNTLYNMILEKEIRNKLKTFGIVTDWILDLIKLARAGVNV